MNTFTFLTTLRSHAARPLVFRAGGETASPGYHLTEVKRVAYETMDCGALTHRWTETQFEIWVPPLDGRTIGRGHMPAEKFLRIIERVERALPLDGDSVARIHASFAAQPAALYAIDSVFARDGRLWVELTPDRTQCKAAERRLAAANGGSCETRTAAAGPSVAEAGCGCGEPKADAAVAACCA